MGDYMRDSGRARQALARNAIIIPIKVIRVAWKVGFVHRVGFCVVRKVAAVVEIGTMGV